MQRETKTFVTPSGKEVVIKTYLTGREANSVKEALLKEMKMDASTGQSTNEVTGVFMIEQEKKLIQAMIVSLEGKTENLLDLVLDLKNEDYSAIVKEINSTYNTNLTPVK